MVGSFGIFTGFSASTSRLRNISATRPMPAVTMATTGSTGSSIGEGVTRTFGGGGAGLGVTRTSGSTAGNGGANV